MDIFHCNEFVFTDEPHVVHPNEFVHIQVGGDQPLATLPMAAISLTTTGNLDHVFAGFC